MTEPFSEAERRRYIPGVAAEAYQCKQRIAIIRMLAEILSKDSHGLFRPPRRIEAHGIDVNISRLPRLQLGSKTQFGKRIAEPLLPHQCQAKCVMGCRIAW